MSKLDELLKQQNELSAECDKFIDEKQADPKYSETVDSMLAKMNSVKAEIDTERNRKSPQDYKEALAAFKKELRTPTGVIPHGEDETKAVAKNPEKFRAELLSSAYCQFLKLHDNPQKQNPMELFAKWGKEHGMTEVECHALGITDDTLGGYFAPVSFMEKVIMQLPAITQLAAKVTREPTSSQSIVYPVFQPPSVDANKKIYPSTYVGSWAKEGPAGDVASRTKQDNPLSGGKLIEVKLWKPSPIIMTHALIMDAKANFQSHVERMIRWTYGLDLEKAILKGSGPLEPLGIMNNADIAVINSGVADEITQDGILDVVYSQPGQYSGLPSNAFVMRRRTYGKIRAMKDPLGQYIYPQSIVAPNTLEGYQVIFSEFMDSVGANAYPMIFGPWEYYVMPDREDFQLLPNTAVFQPDLCLIPFARIGGDVTLTEPFVKMKCAV